jgi:hypothetical protein
MKKPTSKNKITIPIYRADLNARTIVTGIVGIIEYPVAIHRSIVEHEQIQDGVRKRYSNLWVLSHVPTGMGFGIFGKWDKVCGVAMEIKDHPALLMLTSESMRAHPDYEDLSELYMRLRSKWL